jgi:AcrR family transcriptional regulator
MEQRIDDAELTALLNQGLSLRAIADRLNIPRTTLHRHLQKRKGTPEETRGVLTIEPQGTPEVHLRFPYAAELTASWEELQELISWWRERKHSLTRSPDDATRKRRRQTYHVEERHIEAIRRASDLERVDIADIVNRAFEHYFNQHTP